MHTNLYRGGGMPPTTVVARSKEPHFCSVCSISLSDSTKYYEHLQSRLHCEKQASVLNSTISSGRQSSSLINNDAGSSTIPKPIPATTNQHFCETCKCYISGSVPNVNQHINGKQHKRLAEARYNQPQTTLPSITSRVVTDIITGIQYFKDPCNVCRSIYHDSNDCPAINNSTNVSDNSSDGKSVWVVGISAGTKAVDLKNVFSKYGRVITAKVMSQKTNLSVVKKFGYVTLATCDDASKCIMNLHRTVFLGKMISVERATSCTVPPRKLPSSNDNRKPASSTAVVNGEISQPTVEPARQYNITAAKPSEYAKAMFDYEAENDDELPLKENDIVLVISKNCEDLGWWEGEIVATGKRGFFPNNFVALLPPNDVEKYKKMTPPPPVVPAIPVKLVGPIRSVTTETSKQPERTPLLEKPTSAFKTTGASSSVGNVDLKEKTPQGITSPLTSSRVATSIATQKSQKKIPEKYSKVVQNDADSKECPICLEIALVQKYLRCGNTNDRHFMCIKCAESLRKAGNGAIVCPICRQKTALKDGCDELSLKSKFFLSLQCEDCSSLFEVKHLWWCIDCESKPCSTCCMVKHKNHNTVPWEDYTVPFECVIACSSKLSAFFDVHRQLAMSTLYFEAIKTLESSIQPAVLQDFVECLKRVYGNFFEREKKRVSNEPVITEKKLRIGTEIFQSVGENNKKLDDIFKMLSFDVFSVLT